MKLVIASSNKAKAAEIKTILKGLPYQVITLDKLKKIPDVVEDGRTFRENAIKKAVTIARVFGELALGDDSGLEVDFLGGLPGIYSARFAGEHIKDPNHPARYEKLLHLLNGVPVTKRAANFTCVVAIAKPDGRYWVVEGKVYGRISLAPKGKRGFGYDQVFIPKGHSKTFAEISPLIKNKISHRAKALLKAKTILAKYLKQAKIS
jgi:XTP/dITP diphosphohydrolase